MPNHQHSNGLFKTTKKDKRIIKRSILLSRIAKNSQPPDKKRRRSKSLGVSLSSLVDALPETDEKDETNTPAGTVAKIKHRSLKSRPGAMKRKESLIQSELERFNRNLVQMINLSQDRGSEIDGGAESNSAQDGTRKRWEAIRGFLQQTMEQRPDMKS